MENLVKSYVQESQIEWGGPWTEKKLDAFAKYVSAYLNIMKKHPQWETLYFDGFAGSGDRSMKCRNIDVIQQLEITEQEERLYKGAAERVLNLPDNLSFKYSAKLQSFFGLEEKEIIEYFYNTETQPNLFGDEEDIITKVSKPIDKIAALYSRQLKKIWKHVMDKPLILKNSKGSTIFHFIFASNNETALKIAKQITKSV